MSELECAYFNQSVCRSCGLLAEPAETRDQAKETRFADSVQRELDVTLGPGPGQTWLAPLWKPHVAFASRTKAKLSVSGTVESPIIGLLGAESTGFTGAELLDCPLHLPEINQVAHAVKEAITRYALVPYDVARRTGELKGLILKSNESGTEVMLRFVLRSRALMDSVKRASADVQKQYPFVRVVSINLQPVPHALLEGEQEWLLSEQSVLWENFEGFSLAFAPQSFSQVTHQTARALYSLFRDRLSAGIRGGLLDLFCGVGGFSFAAQKQVAWSHGVEISTQAIECANLARARNLHSEQAGFTAADVEVYLRDYAGPRPETVLINPPRRGLSESMLGAILKLAPGRVFYSSCNPQTLLRDLKTLRKEYELTHLFPFDMFPLTDHLEVLAELKLKRPSDRRQASS
jgi:23S rRNA (uracil747-C5)-methyltransferase